MKRGDSIGALVQRMRDELGSIRSEYAMCLRNMAVTEALQIDILDYLVHGRCVLDYLAHEVSEQCCSSSPARVYFPICPVAKDQAWFASQMNKWFPGLAASRPDLWRYLISVQHFNGNEWLPAFSELANQNKHVDLVPQSTSGYARVHVGFGGSGFAVGERGFREVQIGPGGAVVLKARDGRQAAIRGPQVVNVRTTHLDDADPGIVITRDTWVDFKFDVSDHSAIGLLEIAHANIERVVADVERML